MNNSSLATRFARRGSAHLQTQGKTSASSVSHTIALTVGFLLTNKIFCSVIIPPRSAVRTLTLRRSRKVEARALPWGSGGRQFGCASLMGIVGPLRKGTETLSTPGTGEGVSSVRALMFSLVSARVVLPICDEQSVSERAK